MHSELQSLLAVIIIIITSIITHITWTCNELIMKGVRRQRHTGCMTMMMIAKFILLANMLSNAVFARERMVQEAAG